MEALVESAAKAYDLPMDEIFLDEEFNCRGRIAPIDVIDLAQNIETLGLQQPIMVQPYTKIPGKKWRIVAGHRRFVAFKINKAETIPAFINRNLSDVDAHTLNLVENLKRKDLNMMQEALSLKIYKKVGWTEQEVAEEISMSRGWVQVRYILLGLPEAIQKVAAAGWLTQEQIKQLHTMPTDKQYEAVRLIKERKEKGQKGSLKVKPRKISPTAKKVRDRSEIFVLQDQIQKSVGNFIGTRLLGWAAGEVSDLEVHRDLQDFAESIGKKYEIPKEILSAV